MENEQLSYSTRQHRKIIARLGGKCNWKGCEWTDPRALQIDHINGGGNKEARERGRGAMYTRILKMEHPEEEYQILCANHNWIKVHEKRERGWRGTREATPEWQQFYDNNLPY